MQIKDIVLHELIGGTVDSGWPEGHEPEDDLHTLVEVITDEGLVGWGSIFTSVQLSQAALDFLRPLWEGESGVQPERVSEKLRQCTWWQGRGGTVEHVISGIDIALWDLFGKACNQPCSRLLGGCYRDRIQPYGSILFDEPDKLAATLEATVSRGFKAIKMGWRPFGRRSREFDELLIRTARKTVGDDITLLVDAGGSENYWPHRYKWAINTAKMLADYNIGWFEEPLAPDDLEGYVELTKNSPVPIAGGEPLTRRQAFFPWIEQRAVDILQPDATKCGGLTETRRIAWHAEDHYIQVVTHGWNTAVGVAADLHLAAAMPVAKYVEYLTPAPYIEDIVTTPFHVDEEGFVQIPDGPGLGIEIDREALKRFSRGGKK